MALMLDMAAFIPPLFIPKSFILKSLSSEDQRINVVTDHF